jgi:hypothetical protein
MPDLNRQQSDSVTEPDKLDPDREFAIEEWKSTQESISSFNDLGLRMRVFGIGGVFLVAGYGIQNIKDDRLLLLFHHTLHSSALIVIISFILLIVVYLLDRHYYSPLLIAAVNYGQELERILRNGKEILDKKALKLMNEENLPKGRDKNPPIQDPTYIWGKSGYISHYVSRVHPSLPHTLTWVYVALAVVLLGIAALLNSGHPATSGSEISIFRLF